jgi:hypothetical protein
VPVMKVPTMGGNIFTGKTSAVTISDTTTQGVFTVAGVMAVAITEEAVTEAVVVMAEGVAAGVEVMAGAVAVVTTKQQLAVLVGREVKDRFNRPVMTRGPGAAAKVSTKHSQMIRISAKVLQVDRFGNQYLVTVMVAREKYSGTFDRLDFGENKPHLASFRSCWLDLAYKQDPGLKAGESFPLWAIE